MGCEALRETTCTVHWLHAMSSLKKSYRSLVYTCPTECLAVKYILQLYKLHHYHRTHVVNWVRGNTRMRQGRQTEAGITLAQCFFPPCIPICNLLGFLRHPTHSQGGGRRGRAELNPMHVTGANSVW